MKAPLFLVLLLCLAFAHAPAASGADDPASVVAVMRRVGDWQLAHPRHNPTDWTNGAFFAGVMALARTSGDAKYLDAMRDMGKGNAWQPGPRKEHADDHAVCQTYLELYMIDKDPAMLAPTRALFDSVVAERSAVPHKGQKFPGPWWWCDALFMGPPALARLAAVTKEKKYIDYMDQEYWKTTKYLYDPAEGFFYRDDRFFDKRTGRGKKIFWSRGNGWVYGGLCRVLEYMPSNYPKRGEYVKLFKRMTVAALKAQQSDGMWRPSLLDPEEIPAGESSPHHRPKSKAPVKSPAPARTPGNGSNPKRRVKNLITEVVS